MTRQEQGRIIARRVADRVRKVAPSGIGKWGPAWPLVEFSSLEFLDVLNRWERADSTLAADAEEALRDAVRAAADDLVAAWADAAVAWEAAGRPTTPTWTPSTTPEPVEAAR